MITDKITALGWTCTDPANFQYGREVRGGVYAFKEFDRALFPALFNTLKTLDILQGFEEEAITFLDKIFNNAQCWSTDIIDLSRYTEEAIEKVISSYNESLAEFKQIYGGTWQWVAAECIFEQESGLY